MLTLTRWIVGILLKMKMDRQKIFEKFGGKCAYSGTDLKDDWQIDHMEPKIIFQINGKSGQNDDDNLFPCQRIINHYKRGLPLEYFRTWYLGGLHERLKKLPKNPKSKKGIRRKAYLLQVAELFGITEDNPFSGVFYFENELKNEK
jgi:hypothetical protein